MDDFPKSWCGLWIDEVGKAVYIEKLEEKKFQTTIIFDLNNQLEENKIHINEHLKRLTTNWTLDSSRNINRLQIEAGWDFVGPTYNLYCGLKDESLKRKVESTDNPLDIVLHSEVEMGLYDDFEDDLGVPWGYPHSKYSKASKDIEERFLEVSKLEEE